VTSSDPLSPPANPDGNPAWRLEKEPAPNPVGAHPGEPLPPGMQRVSDADRHLVDGRLHRAVGDGLLSLREYEERSALLWKTVTRRDLDALVADLPAEGGLLATAIRPVGRSRVSVAVFGSARVAGPADGATYSVAVFGESLVDLRPGGLPPETVVRAGALFGSVTILVPAGVRVVDDGFSVFGDRPVLVPQPQPGAPTVRVRGLAVFGQVSVVADAPGELGQQLDPAAERRRARELQQVARRGRAPVRGHRRGGWLRVVVPVAVVAAVAVGVTGVAHGDQLSVFGSQRVIADGTHPVRVASIFGSSVVVVPDDVLVRRSGAHAFGSSDCHAACDPARPGLSGRTVSVRTDSAFGSADVRTVSEDRAHGD
jgi:hypothetical protein